MNNIQQYLGIILILIIILSIEFYYYYTDPYRVFVEPRNYANGTNLEFVSIVKNAAGKTAVSKTIKYKISY